VKGGKVKGIKVKGGKVKGRKVANYGSLSFGEGGAEAPTNKTVKIC